MPQTLYFPGLGFKFHVVQGSRLGLSKPVSVSTRRYAQLPDATLPEKQQPIVRKRVSCVVVLRANHFASSQGCATMRPRQAQLGNVFLPE
jgi:hypothetical protein